MAMEAVEEGMAVTGSVATTADMVGVAATAAAEAITEDRGKYLLFGPTILIPDCAFEGRIIPIILSAHCLVSLVIKSN